MGSQAPEAREGQDPADVHTEKHLGQFLQKLGHTLTLTWECGLLACLLASYVFKILFSSFVHSD